MVAQIPNKTELIRIRTNPILSGPGNGDIRIGWLFKEFIHLEVHFIGPPIEPVI